MAVAFDVDGTLYPAAALNSRALPLVLRHPLLFAAFGKARRDIRAAARADAHGRPTDATSFRQRQAEITAALLGARKVDRVAELIDDVVYRGVTELFAGLRLYRGLVPALDALAEAGLRLAVLSDLPPLRKLSLMGLEGRFERALCSEDSGFLKPAPEPFRMLGDALHLEPRSVLYVGNSKAYDLEGARAAGMEAAIVSRGRVPGAALSFTEWDRLVELATS
jgi:putative hydrolase of the HAD superfamily